MFCRICGNELPDGTKFCPVCGTAQEVAPSAPAEVQPEPVAASAPAKRRKSLAPLNIMLAVVLLVLCGVSAFVIFKVKGDRDSSSGEKLKEYKIVSELPDGDYNGRSPVIEDPEGIQSGSCEVDIEVKDGEVVRCEPVLYDPDGVRKDADYIEKLDEEKREKVQFTIDAVVQYAKQLEDTGDADEVEPIEGAEIIYDQFKGAIEDILEKANQSADAPPPEKDGQKGGKKDDSEDEQRDDSKDDDNSREDPLAPIPEPEKPQGPDYEAISEKLAQIVKDNEAIWLTPINENIYFGAQYEDPNCWFEDVDFDDAPEFIIGGFNMMTQGGISYRVYKIDEDNGTLKLLNPVEGGNVRQLQDDGMGGGSVNATCEYGQVLAPGFAGAGGEVLKDPNGGLHFFFDYIASYIDDNYAFEEVVFDTAALTAEGKGGAGYIHYSYDDTYKYFMKDTDYEGGEFADSLDEHFEGWTHVDHAHGGYIPCTKSEVDRSGYSYICGRYDDLSDADRLEVLKQSCRECLEAKTSSSNAAPNNYTKLRAICEELNPTYDSFAAVVRAKEKDYGQLKIKKTVYDYMANVSAVGVMYLDLLDMDGDGTDELLIGCVDGSDVDYDQKKPSTLEIWANKNGKAKCVFKGNVAFSRYGADSNMIVIYRDRDGLYGFLNDFTTADNTEDITGKMKMIKYKNGKLSPDYISDEDFVWYSEDVRDFGNDEYSGYRENYIYMFTGANADTDEWTDPLKKLVKSTRAELGLE